MTTYYKALNKDGTCRGFKFEEGKTYELKELPILCKRGFHFCKELVLTLQYYPVKKDITENLYAEVEVLGDVEFEQPHQHKGCTNRLRIIRFLTDDEVKALVSGRYNSGHSNSGHSNSGNRNSGHSNSGDRNSGDYNSGRHNSGDYNSGNRNSGRHNSGDYNSGDWNSTNGSSGYLNTQRDEIIQVFNKPCLRSVWEASDIPNFFYFNLGDDYKQSWLDSYAKASNRDKAKVKALPNYDAEVFFELTGIDLR